MSNSSKLQNPQSRFFLFLFLIIVSFLLSIFFGKHFEGIRKFLEHLPLAVAGLFYIVMYVGITTVFWFGTIDIFRISGALLFGAYWSTLFIFIAEIFNAGILFQLSRKLGQEFVQQKFRLKEKDLRYAKEPPGFWRAFILRINPFVPYRIMDLGFGLSKISFQKYMTAVIFGSPARIFLLQFVIAALGEAFLKNPMAVLKYLQNNQTILLFYGVYLTFVLVVTITGIIISSVKKRQSSKMIRS